MQWSKKSRPLHAKALERVHRWLLGTQEKYIHIQTKAGVTIFSFSVYGSTLIALMFCSPCALYHYFRQIHKCWRVEYYCSHLVGNIMACCCTWKIPNSHRNIQNYWSSTYLGFRFAILLPHQVRSHSVPSSCIWFLRNGKH